MQIEKIKRIAEDIKSDKEWVNDSHTAAEYEGVKSGLDMLVRHLEETKEETKTAHNSNQMKDIIENLSVEQIESLYEKTFGNPIDHYPSMEVSQMIDEIVEEVSTQDLKEVSTQDLRNELELRGYQTDNLWHIEDVMLKYDCESEVAQEVLIKALNNEATIEQVYLAIDIVADEVFNLKLKSDE